MTPEPPIAVCRWLFREIRSEPGRRDGGAYGLQSAPILATRPAWFLSSMNAGRAFPGYLLYELACL